MCVLISLQVCFHSAMKHGNGMSNMVKCLWVVRIYNFMEEMRVYLLLHILPLENNDFIKEIKHALCAFIAWWKPQQSLWEFSCRWSRFSLICSRILPNIRLGFPHAMKFKCYLFVLVNCTGFKALSHR